MLFIAPTVGDGDCGRKPTQRNISPCVPISNVLKLRVLANRDSLPYAETLGLGKLESLQTVLRGTLR